MSAARNSLTQRGSGKIMTFAMTPASGTQTRYLPGSLNTPISLEPAHRDPRHRRQVGHFSNLNMEGGVRANTPSRAVAGWRHRRRRTGAFGATAPGIGQPGL